MTLAHHQTPFLSRFPRAMGLRVLMVLCFALYSVWGVRITPVIVHDHGEVHAGHDVEMHPAPESHHEDHHDGEEDGEHHHHLAGSVSVAMASVTPASHAFFQRFTKLRPTSFDEVCPSGPVFEMIKPPQVS